MCSESALVFTLSCNRYFMLVTINVNEHDYSFWRILTPLVCIAHDCKPFTTFFWNYTFYAHLIVSFVVANFVKIQFIYLELFFFSILKKYFVKMHINVIKWPTELNLLSQKLFCLLEIYACFNVRIRTYISRIDLSRFIFIAKLKLSIN